MLARVAGVDYSVAEALSDDELEARLYRPPLARSSHQLAPDFGVVHQKLKRAGVTLMLPWRWLSSQLSLGMRSSSLTMKDFLRC